MSISAGPTGLNLAYAQIRRTSALPELPNIFAANAPIVVLDQLVAAFALYATRMIGVNSVELP